MFPKVTVLVMGLLFLTMVPSYATCCSYGCCDCSCVSLRAEAKAPRLAKAIGRGTLQSFSINASDQKSVRAAFKCSMQAEVAICVRQQ
ncbi:hypothetical protein JOE50_008064 [Bradyrhizobium japonicum]|nr:hypothetical protein [Bradyrhizobium japonicum]